MEGKCPGTHPHAANAWTTAESTPTEATPPATPAAAAAATPTRSPLEDAEAKAQVAAAMLANMKATGYSSEEVNAAMAQLFLSCPAVNPDEAETKVNVDEFEHTE